jgi:hypothetical protein
MQKLSLLVAASVIGLASAYPAMAQSPAGKPGAKATVQAPALVTTKGNLSSFALVAPGAETWSANTSVGAMARVPAQAVMSATGGKLSALAASAVAASTAMSSVGKANLSAAINIGASPAALKATSNLGSMARVTSPSQAWAMTSRANVSALARVAPTPAMVNKSNFSAYMN